MNQTTTFSSVEPVLQAAEREKTAMAASDMALYLSVLADDALFMPPGTAAKCGEELRAWLRAFLENFTTEWLRFQHGETVVAGNLAFHDYYYSMKVTPKAGGEATIGHGKGLHVLRREGNGAWKIVRNVWNAVPSS